MSGVAKRAGAKDELSKRLADKMLLGWTMLADVCPVAMCHAPLMKDKGGSMWCISCDRRVMTEEDLKAEIDRTAAMTAAGRSSLSSAAAESESDRAARLLRIQQAAAAEPPSALARAAATVRNPAVAQPVAKPKAKQELTARELMDSVEPTEEELSLGSYSLQPVNYESVSLEHMMGAPPAAPTPAAVTVTNSGPSPERGNGVRHGESNPSDNGVTAKQIAEPQPEDTGGPVLSSSEISAQLGDLLLQGWRMLEELCPVTEACPLMQEKSTGRKFSVALQKYTDELDVGPKPGTDASAAPAVTVDTDARQDALSSEHKLHRPATELSAEQVRHNQDPTTANTSMPASTTSSANVSDARSFAASSGRTSDLDKTIATLGQKIMEATRRLDLPSVEVSERILLAQLVGECAASIHALEKLR
jgi:uncharacterized Zn finger protein (UPF0148 family)